MLFHSSLRKELARSFGASFIVLVTVVMTMTLIRTLGQASRGSFSPSDVMMVMGYTVLTFLPNVMTMALKDEDGELQGFARVVRDFTARHERDEKLRRSRARLKLLPAETAIAGIVLVHGYSTALFWIMLIGVAIFLAARIWGWPHFIRWQVEKEMAKHPMQAITGIKLGVQPQGLVMFQRMNNQEGRGVIGWKDFSEWRENDKYLYLTFSVKGQQGMQIIPKRMTAQRFPIDTVRKHLTETLGAAK